RQVRRNRGFSAIAIATLALGIGGITAMFSAVDAVLIPPLPYADADRLVMILPDMRNENRLGVIPTPAGLLGGGPQNHGFAGVAPPEHGIHGYRAHSTGGCHALGRFRARTGSGPQRDMESLECTRCKTADRAGVYRGRR